MNAFVIHTEIQVPSHIGIVACSAKGAALCYRTICLEGAGASKGSINKRGAFQTTELMGLEVHVKDGKRFKGSWAFFSFDDAATAKMIPQTAPCYSCHAAHAAVDTTFVQFYPTLIGTATAKGTLSANYLRESTSH